MIRLCLENCKVGPSVGFKYAKLLKIRAPAGADDGAQGQVAELHMQVATPHGSKWSSGKTITDRPSVTPDCDKFDSVWHKKCGRKAPLQYFSKPKEGARNDKCEKIDKKTRK